MTQSGLPASLRTRSARLARFLTMLVVGLGLLLLLERFSATTLAIAHGTPGSGRQLGLQLASGLPEACFLLALWWVRQALAEFSSGAFFTPIIARSLRRVGVLLSLGAALTIAILPSVQRLLGAPPGYLLAFDVDSLVLCGLGLALAMLASVLERAALLQAELDEIF